MAKYSPQYIQAPDSIGQLDLIAWGHLKCSRLRTFPEWASILEVAFLEPLLVLYMY
jgi:hypothetical protein